MQYSELITEEGLFVERRRECDRLIDRCKRLPDNVFRHKFTRYYAFEHAEIFKREFPAFLGGLAHAFQDEMVNYITIDPDPVGYYFKNYGFYGLASFERSKLEERFLRVMSRDGSVDSFRARGGDLSAFWGSSLKWGIFCDRVSWELCVLGVLREVDAAITERVGCMNLASVPEYVSGQYGDRNKALIDAFKRDFNTNYPG